SDLNFFRIAMAFQYAVYARAKLNRATTHVEPLHLKGHNSIISCEVEIAQINLNVLDFSMLVAGLIGQIMLLADTKPEWLSGRGACFPLHRIRPIAVHRSLNPSLTRQRRLAGSA